MWLHFFFAVACTQKVFFVESVYILHTQRALLYKRQSGNDRLQQQAGRQQHYISSSIACEIAAAKLLNIYMQHCSVLYEAHTFGVNIRYASQAS
jgi:hypothetical protein